MGDIVDSVKVRLGGREFNVPALSLGQVRRLMPVIGLLPQHEGAPLTMEGVDAIIEIVHSAVSRNHKDVTKEEIEELIDLNNAGDVIKIILGQAGLKSGETTAGSQ